MYSDFKCEKVSTIRVPFIFTRTFSNLFHRGLSLLLSVIIIVKKPQKNRLLKTNIVIVVDRLKDRSLCQSMYGSNPFQ